MTATLRSRAASSHALTFVFFLCLAGYFLFPVYWLVVASTKSTPDLVSTHGLWFAHFQLFKNIGDVFSYDSGLFSRWLLNSLIYAGLGALGGTMIAAMAGFGLAKYRFPGREAVFALILGGVLVPPTLLALPIYLLESKLHMTNTYWGVLLPSMIVSGGPFGVYLARVYAEISVPNELLEAGRIEGAGELRIFTTIVLRIMSPALVTIFLFQFVAIWNNFFLPLVVLNDRSLWPVTLGLYAWQGKAVLFPDVVRIVLAGSLVATLPLVIVFFSMQRYLRAGLTAGAIKG